MQARVQRWGNSLAVRIPRAFAEHVGISEGTPIDIGLSGDSLTLTPLDDSGAFLEELLQAVTAENIHPETNWGPPRGKEVW